MAKTSIVISLSSLLFVSSCAELRYMTASFRTTEKVAPTIKDRETVVIMLSSDAKETAKRFISDLHALGYSVKGDITSYYDAKKNKSTEDEYKQVLACGRNADAEVVLLVTMGSRYGRHFVRTDGVYDYYTMKDQAYIMIDILDVTKSKWLVFDDNITLNEESFYDALIEAFK